jgi:hypothetical protein
MMGMMRSVAFHDDEARLTSLLRQLIVPDCPLILDAGCADGRGFPIYRAVYSTARIVGVDWEIASLRAAPHGYTIQADLNRLPFRGGFDLVLARHPDLDRHRSGWARFLRQAPLNDGGLLVVSTYALPEIEQARDWLLNDESLEPVSLAIEHLAPPGLAGRDRFVLVYRKVIRPGRA